MESKMKYGELALNIQKGKEERDGIKEINEKVLFNMLIRRQWLIRTIGINGEKGKKKGLNLKKEIVVINVIKGQKGRQRRKEAKRRGRKGENGTKGDQQEKGENHLDGVEG